MKIELRQCSDRSLAKSRFEEMKTKVERAELGVGGGQVASSNNDAEAAKRRMEDVNTKLERQQETLDNIKSSVAEIEETGTTITSELAKNREVLERTNSRVSELKSGIDNAGKIAGRMAERAKKWWK